MQSSHEGCILAEIIGSESPAGFAAGFRSCASSISMDIELSSRFNSDTIFLSGIDTASFAVALMSMSMLLLLWFCSRRQALAALALRVSRDSSLSSLNKLLSFDEPSCNFRMLTYGEASNVSLSFLSDLASFLRSLSRFCFSIRASLSSTQRWIAKFFSACLARFALFTFKVLSFLSFSERNVSWLILLVLFSMFVVLIAGNE
mmetsp:Transcript_9967/g.15023  ORF Transcript_9967/g.15023 Transcript_9967/m.15023 type:complete len:203 (-) Transcript_9967:645-1253(-)